MREVPILTTERLRLRGHQRDDFPATADLWGAPETVRYITGKASTPAESWARLLNYAGHWALQGFGYWLVEEIDSGHFVGEVGLADFKRGLGPGFDDTPEAGWVLASWCHGRGYATEAVKAAVAWAEQALALQRCVAIINPAHAASLRVAAKCGFTKFAEAEFKGVPAVLLERQSSSAT